LASGRNILPPSRAAAAVAVAALEELRCCCCEEEEEREAERFENEEEDDDDDGVLSIDTRVALLTLPMLFKEEEGEEKDAELGGERREESPFGATAATAEGADNEL
jgi:hypothetical protein